MLLFKILSLTFNSVIVIVMCLCVDLFGFVLFGALWTSWIWMSVSFLRVRKFLDIVSSNKLSAFFPLFFGDPYNVNVVLLDVVP